MKESKQWEARKEKRKDLTCHGGRQNMECHTLSRFGALTGLFIYPSSLCHVLFWWKVTRWNMVESIDTRIGGTLKECWWTPLPLHTNPSTTGMCSHHPEHHVSILIGQSIAVAGSTQQPSEATRRRAHMGRTRWVAPCFPGTSHGVCGWFLNPLFMFVPEKIALSLTPLSRRKKQNAHKQK